MRYFSYYEINSDILTKSEEDIRQEYYPYWYKKMCDKFGKTYTDENYSFEDCITDFVIVNWAWEVKLTPNICKKMILLYEK